MILNPDNALHRATLPKWASELDTIPADRVGVVLAMLQRDNAQLSRRVEELEDELAIARARKRPSE
jgi:hypothetical protein